ncbi:MAG: hypothetical protein WCA46_02620 [Actinocatenispora sp.]
MPEPLRDGLLSDRRPRWRWVAAMVVTGALIGAGASIAAFTFTDGSKSCTTLRQYRARSAGAVLTDSGTVVGRTRPGDVIEVRSLAHGHYRYRYLGVDRRTGDRGYFDEARLRFVGERCV